jgi:hypothetical protein
VNATGRQRAIDDDTGEHEHHPEEDRRMRGQLGSGGAAMVVIEARRGVGDDVGNDREDDDDEPDAGRARESVERFGRDADEVEQARWPVDPVASDVRSVHVPDRIGGVRTASETRMNGA